MRLPVCSGLNGTLPTPTPQKEICPPGILFEYDLIWKKDPWFHHLSCPWTHHLPSRLSSRATMGTFQPLEKGLELPAFEPALSPPLELSAQAAGSLLRGSVSSPTGPLCKLPGGQPGPREEPGVAYPSLPATCPGTSGILCERQSPCWLNRGHP